MHRRRDTTAHELGQRAYSQRPGTFGRQGNPWDRERGLQVHARLEAAHMAGERSGRAPRRFPVGAILALTWLLLLGVLVWILLSR